MASRFAVLKDEGNLDECNLSPSNTGSSTTICNQSKAKKKRSRRKNKSAGEFYDNGHLFSTSQKNEEIAEAEFKRNLHEALQLSKMESVNQQDKGKDNDTDVTCEKEQLLDNSSKTKKSAKVMSLAEFQRMGSEQKETEDYVTVSTRKRMTSATKSDSIQDDVETQNEVERILRQEKQREEFGKRLHEQDAADKKHRAFMEEQDKLLKSRDARIAELEKNVAEWKTKHMKVSKEKIELHRTLEQVQNKDKTDLVRTVASHEQLLTELTRQVSELQIEVEKERSVSHGLRAELDKLRDYQQQQTANRGAAVHK